MRTRGRWYGGVAAVGIAAALVAGCAAPASGNGNSQGVSADPGQAKTVTNKGPFTIGYDIYFTGNSWSTQLTDEFNAEVSKHKSEIKKVYYTQSDGDVNKQISNLQDLIAKKVDAIIVTPISPTALIPVVNQAMAHGIKVILNAAAINSPNYTALVNVNDGDYGKAAAQWLVKAIHGKGNIVLLNGIPGISTNDDRVKAELAVFKKYPKIKIIAQADTYWQYDKAKVAMSNILAAHPEKIDGVLSQGGMVAMGVVDAFHAAQRPIPPLTGDDLNGWLKYWKKYHLNAVGVIKPTYLSAISLDVALNALEGKPYKKNDILPPPLITNKNLNKYIKPSLPDSFWTGTKMTPSEIKKFWTNSSQN